MSILRKAYEKVSAETGVSQAKLKEILYGYYRTAYDIAMRCKAENKPFIMQLFYLGKIYNNDYEKQQKHENQETEADVHDCNHDDGQV